MKASMINYLQKHLIPTGPTPHYLSFSAESLVISVEDSYQIWDLESDSFTDFKAGGYFNAISPCGKYAVMLSADQTLFQVQHRASGATVFSEKDTKLRRTPFCFHGGKLWFGFFDQKLSSVDLSGDESSPSVHHWKVQHPWIWEEMFAIGADRLCFVGYRYRGERSDWYVYPTAELISSQLEGLFNPNARSYEMAEGFALADADGDRLYCLRDFGDDPSPDPEDMEWSGLAKIDALNTTLEEVCPLNLHGRLPAGAPLLVGEKLVVVGLKDSIEVFDRKDGSLVTRFDVERNRARFGYPPIYAFDPLKLRFAFLNDSAIHVVEIG
jgi:hypothetical protein